MGWSEKLPNGRYRAVWRDAQGHKRSCSKPNGTGHFARAAEADRYAGQQEVTVRQGGVGYQGRSMTWGNWCQQWQLVRAIEASTADAELPRIERWLMPKWGSVPLHKITRDAVRAWVKELGEDMAPASVAKVIRILSKSLAEAVAAGHLAVNPCTDLHLPTPAPGGERYLTRAEFDQVLFHMDEPYRTGMIVMAGLGLRFGEMAGLHWDRVNLESMTVTIIETFTSAGGGAIKAYPKSKKPRTIPLSSWVAAAIIARQPATMPTSCGLRHARGSKCTSGLVVPAPGGGALSARNTRARHWIPALERAGIPHARQHDLRHSFASWTLQGGASLSEVGEVLGHSSIVTTQRYAHLAPTHADTVRAILEGAPSSRSQHVVLTYDHDAKVLLSEQPFGTDTRSAFAAYTKADAARASNPAIEVVLIAAESIDAVRQSHASYYEPPADLAG